MFSHLTLLNHHKRIHTQDGTDVTNDQQITVVTQQSGQNLVQGNNLYNNDNNLNENGQNLTQIQIIATEAMDQQVQGGDHQQHHHHQQQVSIKSITIQLKSIHRSQVIPKYYHFLSIINNNSSIISSITVHNNNIMPVSSILL